MPYQLLIFDWDGTLMDSQKKIVTCIQSAAAQCGVSVPSDNDAKQIIGLSLLPAIKKLFDLNGSNEEELANKLVTAYKTIFLEQDQTPCLLFDGVLAMLDDLQASHCDLAVATGKARRGLERVWQSSNTKSYFVDSRCADEAESKPSPDMLKQLLAARNAKAEDAIMIGDTAYDMAMAKGLGMTSIAVTYGVHNLDLLNTQTPTYTVNSVKELHSLLTSLITAN